jgi:ABC-type sugar transport system ATPase subunit
MEDLKLTGISKSFPGVKALQEVSLTILPGEIHALCGENGAGKSTLMNILGGVVQPDEGSINIGDRQVVIRDAHEAFALGISTVHQHLSLFDNLSVAENIFANCQPASRWGYIQSTRLHRQTQDLLERLSLSHIDPAMRVGNLPAAEKQMVEIAKALAKEPSVLILDEPTASLSNKETRLLFEILQLLKAKGTAIVYISHRLEEIYLLADKISVLKDGRYQGTYEKDKLPADELIRLMVGRDIQKLQTVSFAQSEIAMSVRDLSGSRFSNISFDLFKGEILGLAGLVGAGRTEIARAIFGIDARESGEILVGEEQVDFRHPKDAIAKRVAYVPEERRALGLFQDMTIVNNIVSGDLRKAISSGMYDAVKARRIADQSAKSLRIVTPSVEQKVKNLSGGNQQKVVLAKWLLTDPEILIVDEPTHGIDVGAKFEIYEIIRSLASQGKAILMISSDLVELLSLCDRILVVKNGMLTGEFKFSEATEEKIMTAATH